MAEKRKEEFMTVGQAAEKLGVTVRTLQYYDKEGLLSPSARSEGGRRLYTSKDLIQLHQILSLKSLGFSLEEIKKRLLPLDTPAQVAEALAKQEENLSRQIAHLQKSLDATRRLREEAEQMQVVDFKKYADIIINLQMKNEFYFLIKHFDNDTLDYIRRKFDEKSGMAFIGKFTALCDKIYHLAQANVPQNSDLCQKAAGEFWDMIMEFTDGDMKLLPKLMEIGNFQGADSKWHQKQAFINRYIGPALEIYFAKQGKNPFQEEAT